MSDSNRGQIYGVKEVTWGVTPSAALNTIRFTGESLKHAIGNTQSREIRASRGISDLIQVSQEGQGGFDFELSYASFDDYFEGALQSTWGATLTITAATISAASADNSINDSGSGFPAFVAGQWVKIAGFSGGGPNGYARVVSRTTAKLVLAGLVVTTDAAGESVTVSGTMLRDGTTLRSFTLERYFTDITQFIAYTGMVVGDMSVGLTANEIITGRFGFMGKAGSAPAGTTVGTGAAVAANGNDVLSAVANVAQLLEADAVLTGTYARALTFAVNNNLRGKPAIGVLGNTAIGLGSFVVTGNLQTYFENATLYNKFRLSTSSSIATRVGDAAGNNYMISFPRIEFTDGNNPIAGQSQDVMLDLAWQAVEHPTFNCTMQIDKFPAA